MYNNFLCYSRNNIITQNALQNIKSKYTDLYCDYFDNIFCKVENNIRIFSNKGIGFCLDNLLSSNSIYYINTQESPSLFTQIELLISNHLNKKVYILNYNTYNNFKISICNDINLHIKNILDRNNSTNNIFLAYTRNTNNYKILLKRFKKACGENIYIDCLDNTNLRFENYRINYTAFNKNCTYSTNIFDEVFNNLIACRIFCFIDTNNIYKNDFVRMQYIVAKILNKEIFYIKENDFYNIINNKVSFINVLKKADLLYCDRKFLYNL